MRAQKTRQIHATWLTEAALRIRTFWLLKMFGTAAAMTLFFVAYFWVLRHPQYKVTVMPVYWIDRWISFRPESIGLYGSLWIYVSLSAALKKTMRELLSAGLTWISLGSFGLAIFFFWPSAVPVRPREWGAHSGLSFLNAVDASGNACPSLHVAFAVLSACWIERELRAMEAGRISRSLNWLWCVGIAYSTLATRQHVAVDVGAGAVLGAAVVFAQSRIDRVFRIA